MGVNIVTGPATKAPRLIERFNTDPGTQPGDLVVLSGTDTVTKITDNTFATMPNGIFGVGFSKPDANTIDVIFSGIVDTYSGLTAGLAVFVNTDGTPTHTPPTSGMSQEIGKAVNSTEIFVQLKTAIRID
jgi:hypothetical protein